MVFPFGLGGLVGVEIGRNRTLQGTQRFGGRTPRWGVHMPDRRFIQPGGFGKPQDAPSHGLPVRTNAIYGLVDQHENNIRVKARFSQSFSRNKSRFYAIA